MVATVTTVAHASTITGDAVTCAQTGGGSFSCTPATAVVGAGTEFIVGNSNPFIDVDFSGSKFNLTFERSASLLNTILQFTDTTNPFSSYTFLSQTGITGFDPSKVSLVNGLLTVNLRGTVSAPGDGFTLELGTTNPVPEPSSFMLLGTGVLGLAGAARKKLFA